MKLVFTGICGFFIGFGLVYFVGAFASADYNIANWAAGAIAAIAWFGLLFGVVGLGICVDTANE